MLPHLATSPVGIDQKGPRPLIRMFEPCTPDHARWFATRGLGDCGGCPPLPATLRFAGTMSTVQGVIFVPPSKVGGQLWHGYLLPREHKAQAQRQGPAYRRLRASKGPVVFLLHVDSHFSLPSAMPCVSL